MTTHEDNPYRQTVDELLERQAEQQGRREQAENEGVQRRQAVIKSGQDHLGRSIPQMKDELVRLDAPTVQLADDVRGWKLDERFAVGDNGQLYYAPSAFGRPLAAGQGASGKWAVFNLEEQMTARSGFIRYSQWHKGNIGISSPGLTTGLLGYVDERFDKLVNQVLKTR